MRTLVALAFTLFALPAFAQAADHDKRLEQARIFVGLTTAESVMAPMIDAMWPNVEMQLPRELNLEVVERMKTTFAEEITATLADVFDELAAAYAGAFTLEELVSINKFYSSPTGAKLIAQQGPLMQEMMPSITTRLQQSLPAAITTLLTEAQAEGLLPD